jgi:hypothetical protein
VCVPGCGRVRPLVCELDMDVRTPYSYSTRNDWAVCDDGGLQVQGCLRVRFEEGRHVDASHFISLPVAKCADDWVWIHIEGSA